MDFVSNLYTTGLIFLIVFATLGSAVLSAFLGCKIGDKINAPGPVGFISLVIYIWIVFSLFNSDEFIQWATSMGIQ